MEQLSRKKQVGLVALGCYIQKNQSLGRLMITKIPMPLISAISELVVANETHAQINSLFMHAEASGESPDVNDPGINKLNKCLTWLQRTNREHPAPLNVAAAILEKYLDDPAYQDTQSVSLFGLPPTESPTSKAIKRIETILANNNLTYTQGGGLRRGSVPQPKRYLN